MESDWHTRKGERERSEGRLLHRRGHDCVGEDIGEACLAGSDARLLHMMFLRDDDLGVDGGVLPCLARVVSAGECMHGSDFHLPSTKFLREATGENDPAISVPGPLADVNVDILACAITDCVGVDGAEVVQLPGRDAVSHVGVAQPEDDAASVFFTSHVAMPELFSAYCVLALSFFVLRASGESSPDPSHLSNRAESSDATEQGGERAPWLREAGL